MNNIYKTSDLYFASYLVSCGKTFKGTEKKSDRGKNKIVFIFEIDEDDLKQYSTSFFSGTATTNVVQFIYALKNLKTLCFSAE